MPPRGGASARDAWTNPAASAPSPSAPLQAAAIAAPADPDDWKNGLAAPQRDGRVQTTDVTSTKMTEFSDLYLKRELQMGIYEVGFERPSPVQEAAIPLALASLDVIARAKNGTGKTGAYVIPALEMIDIEKKAVQVLILVPARELALQVSQFILQVGKHLKATVLASVGGGRVATDVMRLQHDPPHILVSTPGRALDLVEKQACDLSQVKLVCLDEADKLLSEDFEPIVRKCISKCAQPKPQILLFSATFPGSVQKFMDEKMDHPEVVNLMDELTLVGVTQFCVLVEEGLKLRCLHALFKKLQINQSIIFCNSVARVELLARKVHDFGYACYYIHSRMDQHNRNRVFDLFRQGKARHLVCSDVFARGIDVQAVNVVINFDFPRTSETYLHRIGRSGRFGHLGIAINFVTNRDRRAMYAIEKELSTTIEPIPPEIPLELYTI